MVLPANRHRFNMALSPDLWEQVRELAIQERRPINSQLELLIERGLRSYGLDASAA